MTALERLRDLFLGESAAVAPVDGAATVALPPVQVNGVGVVTTPADPERPAREALAAAQAVLVDLTVRRDSTLKTIESLVAERSRIGRGLATGEASDSDFAQAETSLDASLARRDALDELLLEAEAARREAQLALNVVQAPRLAEERRVRVAEIRAAAEAAAEHFAALYGEAASTLATLADRLDALALYDLAAAQGIGRSLTTSEGDPLFRLTRGAAWVVHARSSFVPVEFRLFAVSPPAGR